MMSATMAAAIAEIIEHGGHVVRHQGGFWTYPSCPRSDRGIPDWYVGTTTIQALVVRGHLEYSEWKVGRAMRFPIAAKVKEAINV